MSDISVEKHSRAAGTYGDIYVGTNRANMHIYALKACNRSIRDSDSVLKELNELKAGRNTMVVKDYSHFASKTQDYLLMEFLDGGLYFEHLFYKNVPCLELLNNDKHRDKMQMIVREVESFSGLNFSPKNVPDQSTQEN